MNSASQTKLHRKKHLLGDGARRRRIAKGPMGRNDQLANGEGSGATSGGGQVKGDGKGIEMVTGGGKQKTRCKNEKKKKEGLGPRQRGVNRGHEWAAGWIRPTDPGQKNSTRSQSRKGGHRRRRIPGGTRTPLRLAPLLTSTAHE